MDYIKELFGFLEITDYFVYFFGNMVMMMFMWFKAKETHARFKTKVFIYENFARWVVGLFVGFFLLITVPEGIWMMFEVDWNVMFSGVVGLFPMYLFKKFMKISKSKLRDLEDFDIK